MNESLKFGGSGLWISVPPQYQRLERAKEQFLRIRFQQFVDMRLQIADISVHAAHGDVTEPAGDEIWCNLERPFEEGFGLGPAIEPDQRIGKKLQCPGIGRIFDEHVAQD